MLQVKRRRKRNGAVLPIITVCLVGLMSFVALAIDIGMMAVARSQAQNAADISALAGARTLDGRNVNNNLTAATTMSRTAATNNSILNTAITTAQVTTVQAGIYRYDATAGKFQVIFGEAPSTNEAYGVMQVTISTQQPTYFARIMGVNSLNIGATATAVHRPRDVAIVLDFSGSMGYSSQFSYPSLNSPSGSLNPDSRFPRFGPWSIYDGSGMVLDYNNPGSAPANLSTYTPATPMQRIWAHVDGSGYLYAPNNLTIDTPAGPAIVTQFLQSDNSTSAFVSSGGFPSFTNVNVSAANPTTVVTPAPDTFSNQNASNFVGDKFPLRSGVTVSGTTAPTASQYAHTVQGYLTGSNTGATTSTRNATFETNGYDWDFATSALKPASQRFQGFTMGPGYYGKTFYMWPPDPRTPVGQIGDATYKAGDWRRRFFLPRSGSTQNTLDNSMLWDTTNERFKAQNPGTSANYIVNYDNILQWIKRGPQTLPPSLRCGRVVYYDSIPTTIPISQSTGLCTSGATADQRFWKDYIDYVIGAGKYSATNNLYSTGSANSNSSGGSTVYYNTASSNLATKITARSSLTGSPVPYMHYGDSPVHPRAHFWFGPLTMLGFMEAASRTGGNWLPGNCYEAQCWQLKAGVKSALDDIKNNHPNDLASLIYFSSSGGYGTARVGMGKDYTTMQNCLYYPYSLLSSLGNATSTVRAYGTTTPSNANPAGLTDIADTVIPNSGTSTCPEMGLKVAYNQLSNATDTPTSTTFTGRKTAAKMVIFETDGIPNHTSNGSMTATGGYHYTGITSATSVGESTSATATPKTRARSVVQQIVAMDTANPPGFSTTRTPAQVHAIAFGELFESYSTSPMKGPALDFLTAVQIDGKTTASGGSIEDYKIIIGDYNTRISKLREAFERIMQGGIQVALIQ